MAVGNQARLIRVKAGTTVAMQLLQMVFPLGYTIIVPAGGNAVRRGSCALRPGGRYVAPAVQSNLQPGGHAIGETTPISWVEITANTNDVELHIAGGGVNDIAVHYSDTDVMPANSAINAEVKAGESIRYQIEDLIQYAKGGVAITVESADETKTTAEFNERTGVLTVNGIAATADTDITVNATSPAGNTSTVTISVEVT